MLNCTKCNKSKELSEFHKWSCSQRGYRYHCKDCRKGEDKERKLNHYYKNKEKYLSTSKKWKEDNKDNWNSYMKEYRKNNKEKISSYPVDIASKNIKRRGLIGRSPSWSDKSKIKEIYKLSKSLSKKYNVVFHVDHIIPLSKGGLHVWWNLDILTSEENLRKSIKIKEENIICPRVPDNFEDYLSKLKMYAELTQNQV